MHDATSGSHSDTNQGPNSNQTSEPTKVHRSRFSRIKDALSSHEFRQLRKDPRAWVEVIALMVLMGYTYFAGHQVAVMNRTLEEIKKQTSYADVSAKAAKSAADTATTALTASIEQFRIDERAWIEIEPIKAIPFSPKDEKFGATFLYNLYIRNVGKTVARDIRLRASRQGSMSSINMGSDAKPIEWEQDKLLLGKVPSAKDIPINNPVERTLAPNTTAAVPLILNGQEPWQNGWVSFLIGRVDYTDGFGVEHWKKFCFFVANARGELWNCQEGNDEDRNPETPPGLKH
jgi:hypothetical protein